MTEQLIRPPLPDYERPPVIETILGVQFQPLPGLTNAHLGAFWATLETQDWSTVADALPLQNQSEQFSEAGKWSKGLTFQLSQVPQSRMQAKNSTGDRMVQVQNGRLHFNWLGESGGPYPRYSAVKAGFCSALERFLEFLDRAELGKFQADQWEVTYINHIPQGTVWQTPADWGFFQLLQSVPTIDGLIAAESFGGEWHFVIPPKAGRLHVGWQHALKTSPDQKEQEIVQLTLTARGPVAVEKSEPRENLLDGLDIGHETIVRSFERLTSKEANRFWGIKNVSD